VHTDFAHLDAGKEIEEFTDKSKKRGGTLAIPLIPIGAAAASYAVDLAVQGVKYLISLEAAKYDETSYVSTVAYPAVNPDMAAVGGKKNVVIPHRFTMTTGAVIIATRCAEAKELVPPLAIDDELKNLPILTEKNDTFKSGADQIEFALKKCAALEATSDGRKWIEGVLRDAMFPHSGTAAVDSSVLTFCFVAAVLPADYPRSDQGRSFKIVPVAYYYPAIKAKNLCIDPPFVDWAKTQSMFTLGMKGPVGAGGAESFDAAVAFPVRWNRRESRNLQKPFWVWFDGVDGQGSKRTDDEPPHVSIEPSPSKPIFVPPHYEHDLTVALVETSDMKKKLEQLEEAVGKISIDKKKFEEWFGKKDSNSGNNSSGGGGSGTGGSGTGAGSGGGGG